MNHQDQEIEVKFFITNLPGFEARILAAGGVKVQERVRETNLRFDLPDHSLMMERRVLRLRQDVRSVLTFKGPAASDQQVMMRQEIETTVGDFAAARKILEALGYQVVVMYEKWRATYRMEEVEIVVDELPYGNFCEIEGTNAGIIQSTAGLLDLDWNNRIIDSYLAMFWRLKTKLNLKAENLDFASFAGLDIRPEDLEVRPADR